MEWFFSKLPSSGFHLCTIKDILGPTFKRSGGFKRLKSIRSLTHLNFTPTTQLFRCSPINCGTTEYYYSDAETAYHIRSTLDKQHDGPKVKNMELKFLCFDDLFPRNEINDEN